MRTLDNIGFSIPGLPGKGRKVSILVWLVLAGMLAQGCGNTDGAPVAPSSRPVAEDIQEADRLYGERADLMKVRQGVIALRQALAAHPSNYDVAWRLAKLNYYLGAHSSESKEQERAFRDGTEAGKLAIKLSPDKPDGHFWLGANYGGNAEISMLAGLAEIEDIKREMEAVIRMDEAYESGSAYMALGQMYLKAPRMLGGDTAKAIDYLEKGLKFGPNNGLLRLRLAEAYAGARRNDDARKQIETLLAMQPSPGYEPEHSDAVSQARKLQEKIK